MEELGLIHSELLPNRVMLLVLDVTFVIDARPMMGELRSIWPTWLACDDTAG